MGPGRPGRVLLVLMVVGAGYAYYLTHDLNRVHVRGLIRVQHRTKRLGTENILMVGSTSRCALAVQNPGTGSVLRGSAESTAT